MTRRRSVSSVTDYVRVEVPRDEQELIEFLCNDMWPFHGRPRLASTDVGAIDFASSDVNSFWIIDGGHTVGLIRLIELEDIGEGTPQFDLRIASAHRGQGHGRRATRWIVDHLFTAYPELQRIEANTRHDNVAMQATLSKAGFTLEGRLRASWRGDEREWFDTMVYGMLRSEWRAVWWRTVLGRCSPPGDGQGQVDRA